MRSDKKAAEYAVRAKETWGATDAYKEFEKKSAGRSREEDQVLGTQLMAVFGEFGKVKSGSPESPEAQALVKKLQDYITEHYYTCTDDILLSLGEMYSVGGEFTENIDNYAGAGTAAFITQAIEAYILSK